MTTSAHPITLSLAIVLLGCTDDPSPAGDPPPSIGCGQDGLHAGVHDECDPMEAEPAPDEDGNQCRCILGFAWNGSACEMIGDCRCVGADCDKLADTLEECQAAHALCSPPVSYACGDAALHRADHAVCAPMDATAAPGDDGACDCALGYAWNGTACAMLANCRCVGADCDKLAETEEECQSAHAECGLLPPAECGDPSLYSATHHGCGAMDAVGAGGGCRCFLGYAWNGTECAMLGDCGCVGEDCDKLTETKDACEAAHASCG